MQVLVAYERLIQSAIEKFCNFEGPSHKRTSDTTCSELHELISNARDGIVLDERNNTILNTLRGRAEEAHARIDGRAASIENPVDLAALEAEVQELRQRVNALEERLMQPASSPESSAALIGEYTATSTLFIRKEDEFMRTRLAAQRRDIDAALAGIQEHGRAIGRGALYLAAVAITRDMPDSLSIWSYRIFQLKERAKAMLDEWSSTPDSWNATIKIFAALLDAKATAIIVILDIVTFYSKRGVQSLDDVAALLTQRENLCKVIEVLRLQNRHLEPLITASNLR